MTRLPPLNALVAFRAVMDTGSLVSAAQKLSITASAVSHRLKALEDHLGMELFERRSRAVFPTAAAHRYSAEISIAFDRISSATKTLESVGNKDTLSIHCIPSFSRTWLLKRLSSFQSQNPEITLSIASMYMDYALDDGQYDIDICRTDSLPQGMKAISLGREKFRPLISPKLLEKTGYPKKPADLVALPLIKSVYCPISWEIWLQEAGVEPSGLNEVMTFRCSALAVEAAVHGFGIVLESSVLSYDMENESQLVPLFPEYQSSGSGFSLTWNPKREGAPQVQRFCEWVEGQMVVKPRAMKAEQPAKNAEHKENAELEPA
ncbi:LysR substrate-binding domain-containing protein [Flexibacterium corallicola]|uniref:LysR substrate-binding domain-containing protein n=1 Tax=Flexibacterium corallicola TaxID=3037259 RepID=UPI00286EFA3C|nr:LysR substrate-binding domain-containing protein [Pseudovibrio sp. M1P-2-3]